MVRQMISYCQRYLMSNIIVSGISRVSHYTSVFNVRNPQPQLIPRFAFTFLADVTGVDQQRSCQTIQDCGSDEYCVKQRCIKTFTAYHDAYGTGLQYDEGTGEIKVVDPTKGTWTESTWVWKGCPFSFSTAHSMDMYIDGMHPCYGYSWWHLGSIKL